MTTIRAAVVSLMLDIDFDRSTPPTVLFHQNGDPFTEAETALVATRTQDELDAVARYLDLALQQSREDRVAVRRLFDMSEPYFQAGAFNLLDVETRMAGEERAEFRALLDQVAPDGNLVIALPPATPERGV